MHVTDPSALADQFAIAINHLGPFEPAPRLAVAVSGGADSVTLCLLAQEWVVRRGGGVLALTVDHGLRDGSSREADAALEVLAARGIPGRTLTIADLARGPALAARAREARYHLLLQACVAAGIVHLLLGHHRSDQAETVMMRALSSSGARGLAGMPALTETRFVRLLRPLLNVAPESPRAYLTQHAVPWIEDPSNRAPAALRSRLRAARADPSGTGAGTIAVAQSARRAAGHRAMRDRVVAETLAERATILPEGYALLTPGPIDPEALAALLRAIAGAPHAPPLDRVAVLARAPRPATLGGVRIVPAGRLGSGWLLIRERRAMMGAVPAMLHALWDGRFRLVAAPPDFPFVEAAPDFPLVGTPPDALPAATERRRFGPATTGPATSGPGRDSLAPDLTLGALAADAARFRDRDGLPTLVLHGLPALRSAGILLAIPHIGFGDPRWRLLFDPRNPAAGAPFSSGHPSVPECPPGGVVPVPFGVERGCFDERCCEG